MRTQIAIHKAERLMLPHAPPIGIIFLSTGRATSMTKGDEIGFIAGTEVGVITGTEVGPIRSCSPARGIETVV